MGQNRIVSKPTMISPLKGHHHLKQLQFLLTFIFRSLSSFLLHSSVALLIPLLLYLLLWVRSQEPREDRRISRRCRRISGHHGKTTKETQESPMSCKTGCSMKRTSLAHILLRRTLLSSRYRGKLMAMPIAARLCPDAAG